MSPLTATKRNYVTLLFLIFSLDLTTLDIGILYKYMTIKFSDVVSKTDFAKLSILIVVAIGCWIWVWTEYQKPILPPEFEQNYLSSIKELHE